MTYILPREIQRYSQLLGKLAAAQPLDHLVPCLSRNYRRKVALTGTSMLLYFPAAEGAFTDSEWSVVLKNAHQEIMGVDATERELPARRSVITCI